MEWIIYQRQIILIWFHQWSLFLLYFAYLHLYTVISEVPVNYLLDFSSRIKRRQHRHIIKSMGKKTFEDVMFIVGQNRTEFKANRFRLAIISDVFKAMLFGRMQESNANTVIHISDIKRNGFQSVLNYGYLKDPKNTTENVVSVKNIEGISIWSKHICTERKRRILCELYDDISFPFVLPNCC